MDIISQKEVAERTAGFWIRFAATFIDAAIIYIALTLIERILNRFNVYVPFEITFLVLGLLYTLILVTLRGNTVGKWACGLTVKGTDGQRSWFLRTFVRETVGKLASAVPLGFGFMWIGFTKKKRGWHDYVARTQVVRSIAHVKRGNILIAAVLVAMGTWLTVKAVDMVSLYQDWRQMVLPENVTTRYSSRDPSTLTEVSSLSHDDQSRFSDWLNGNGKDPVDYVVDEALRHQVTIIGEIHDQKDYLDFLNILIPELYHRAGVTCVAMEVCAAEDNERLNKLVTSPGFDRELALDLARHGPWGIWGDKEYWDVFETVWRLNKSIPDGQRKMRLIGIDSPWDGPSFALLGLGEDARKGPLWERLRAGRCVFDFVRMLKRDELMAKNIEKEIVERNVRGIVWVGNHHAFVNYRQPVFANGRAVREMGRMAFMLHEKYGDKIFDIRLHWPDFSPSLVNAAYQGPEPMMGDFIETVMRARGDKPTAFTVEGSPFSALRDSNSYYYHFQPTVSFSDLASGYLFLKPRKQISKCTWLEGYVSEEMFLKNKPYYEAIVRQPLHNAHEMNELMKTNQDN